MSAQEAYNLTEACGDVFDVKTLRVGQAYRAYYGSQDDLRYLVYDRDRASSIVFSCRPPYDAWGSLLEDAAKYQVIMNVLGTSLYRELRSDSAN